MSLENEIQTSRGGASADLRPDECFPVAELIRPIFRHWRGILFLTTGITLFAGVVLLTRARTCQAVMRLDTTLYSILYDREEADAVAQHVRLSRSALMHDRVSARMARESDVSNLNENPSRTFKIEREGKKVRVIASRLTSESAMSDLRLWGEEYRKTVIPYAARSLLEEREAKERTEWIAYIEQQEVLTRLKGEWKASSAVDHGDLFYSEAGTNTMLKLQLEGLLRKHKSQFSTEVMAVLKRLAHQSGTDMMLFGTNQVTVAEQYAAALLKLGLEEMVTNPESVINADRRRMRMIIVFFLAFTFSSMMAVVSDLVRRKR